MRGTMGWDRVATYPTLSYYGDMTSWLPQTEAGVAQRRES